MPLNDRIQAEQGRSWWVGALDNCPKQNLMLLGVTFQHRGLNGRRGSVVGLSDARLQELMEAMGRHVVRDTGAGLEVVRLEESGMALPSDRALADFLFAVPLDRAQAIAGAVYEDEKAPEPPSVLVMLSRGETEDDWAGQRI